LEIADKFNLLVTGGSDCHGMSKGKPLIGTIRLPYQHVEKLKAAVESKVQGSKSKADSLSPTPGTL
jgi:3',5'-nucleoside bisphosphate phosphatase